MTAGDHPPPLLCTNVVVTNVEPLERVDHVKTIDPTARDVVVQDSLLPVLFAYRLTDNTDSVYNQMVDRIKEGLRKVLVPFFPWAGRWTAVSDGRGRQLQCNDKGVPFIEAYVDQNLDSVLRISTDFQPVPELQGYGVLGMSATQFKQTMVPDGLPSVFVQVTRFKCGGLVVAATFNHMLADAKSFFDFMKAWSDFSRTNKTDIICDHNRAVVDTSNPASSESEALIPRGTWAVKSYEVSASVITSLKSQVKMSAEAAYVSTVDCIFAHIWKTVSSLPISVTGGQEIGMLNAVEGRTRFYDPPLPNLLGNIVVNMRAPSISTAELLEMPLPVVASKIREKMITTSRETWLSHERITESLDVFTNDKVSPWVQTCWSSFPAYEVDFGFGNPFFMPGPNTSFSMEMLGMSYIGPPTPGVSSSAAFTVIWSTPQLFEALEDHPDFLPFFLPKRSEKPTSPVKEAYIYSYISEVGDATGVIFRQGKGALMVMLGKKLYTK